MKKLPNNQLSKTSTLHNTILPSSTKHSKTLTSKKQLLQDSTKLSTNILPYSPSKKKENVPVKLTSSYAHHEPMTKSFVLNAEETELLTTDEQNDLVIKQYNSRQLNNERPNYSLVSSSQQSPSKITSYAGRALDTNHQKPKRMMFSPTKVVVSSQMIQQPLKTQPTCKSPQNAAGSSFKFSEPTQCADLEVTIQQKPIAFYRKTAELESASPIKQEEQQHLNKIESIRNLIKKASVLGSPTNALQSSKMQFFNDGDEALETESRSPFRLKLHGPKEDTDLSHILNESTIKNVFDLKSTRKTLIGDVDCYKESFLFQQPTQQIDIQDQANKIHLQLELNLSFNKLKDISGQLFQKNLYLRCIDLKNNAIAKLPDSICELPSLWKLRLDYNNLVELPAEMGSLRKLEYLTVSQNRLSSLPKSLFNLGNKLQVLYLNDNKLTSIQPSVHQLTGLKVLLLHNNHLAELSSSLCSLQKLQELSLDWFYYFDEAHQPGQKVLKDELGAIIISDFLQFLSMMQANSTKQVLFVQFLMYFHKLTSLSDLKTITFKSKSRGLMHSLAMNGVLYLMKHLQQYCDLIDVNQGDEEQTTPLVFALKNKKLDVVKYLISLPQTNINKASLKHGCPLHVAIEFHEYKMAMKILQAGDNSQYYKFLDVNAKNKDGNNALHLLFMKYGGKPDMMEQIKGIAVALIKKGININAKNNSNFTPLHLAFLNNQVEAVQFAIEHNRQIYQYRHFNNVFVDQDLNLFNFNERGGQRLENCLHLAARSNGNQKLLIILLESKEDLDVFAVDNEGHQPKEICPFNSPLYKVLVNYERQVLHSKSNFTLNTDCELVHNNVSRRNYESPRQTRKKLLEKATQEQQSKASLKSKQSYERLQTMGNNTRFSNLVSQTDKKPQHEVIMFSQPDEDIQFESYYLKQDVNLQIRKPLTFRSHVRSSTISNGSVTSRVHNQITLSDQVLEKAGKTMRQECVMMAYMKKAEDRKRVAQMSNCSSFNGSRCSDHQDHQGSQSPRRQSEIIVKANIKCSNSLVQSLVQPVPYSQDIRSRSPSKFQQVIVSANESFQSKQVKIDDEEDDANIPEDEDDHINAQVERPNSSLKQLNGTSSLYMNSEGQEKQQLIQAIISEIQRSQERLKRPQSQIEHVKSSPLLISTCEEQGQVGMADVSIQDESFIAARDPPKQDCLSPKFAATIKHYKDEERRLSSEFKKPQIIWQLYETFYRNMIKLRGKSDFTINESEYLVLNYTEDYSNVCLLLDQAYLSLHFLPINMVMNLLNTLQTSDFYTPKGLTQRFKDYIMYEYVNTLTIKIDQNKRRRQSEMHFKKQLTIEESIPNSTFKVVQTTPSFKVFFKKSPSVSVLHQEVPVNDLQNSPDHRKPDGRELLSTFVMSGVMTPKLLPTQIMQMKQDRSMKTLEVDNTRSSTKQFAGSELSDKHKPSKKIFPKRSLSSRGPRNSQLEQSPKSRQRDQPQTTSYSKYKKQPYTDKVPPKKDSKLSQSSLNEKSGMKEMQRLLQQSRNHIQVKAADFNRLLIEAESPKLHQTTYLQPSKLKNGIHSTLHQYDGNIMINMTRHELESTKSKNMHSEKMQLVGQSAIRMKKMFNQGNNHGVTQRLSNKNSIFAYGQNETKTSTSKVDKSRIRKGSTIIVQSNMLSPSKPGIQTHKPMAKVDTLKKNKSVKKISNKQFQNL